MKRPAPPIPVRLLVIGLSLQLLGMLTVVLSYNAVHAIPYSPLNHFVSELTSPSLTPKADVLNFSMAMGMLLSLPCLVRFAREIRNPFAAVGLLGAGVAAFAVCLLAFHPIERLDAHIRYAFLFFGAWLVTVFGFGVGFWRTFGWRTSPVFSTATVLSLISSSTFLFMVVLASQNTEIVKMELSGEQVIERLRSFHRPAVWMISILEWCLVTFVFVWNVSVAWTLKASWSVEK